jgi:FOG: WD40-like repeat
VLSAEPEAGTLNADRRGDRRTAERDGYRRLTSKAARYSSVVGEYSRREAAERAGVSVDDLNPLVELGILTPDDGDRFSAGDVRRIGLIQSFVAAGLPLDGLAADMRQGGVSLAFLDSPGFNRFPSFSGVTFQELSTQTGVPVELLMVIREAIGAALPAPEDRVREDEMAIVPLIEAQLESGFKHTTIERALRAIGDSLRRVAEVEADWFHTEVIEPRVAGKTGAEIAAVAVEFSERFAPLNDRSVAAMYHAHQAHASTGNLIGESSPAVGSGLVYIGDLSGVVHAVNATDGSRAWTFKTGSEVKSSAVIAGERILIGSYDTYLYALDRRTGKLAWKLKTDGQVHATPAVVNGIIYFGGCDERFRAVRATDFRSTGRSSLGISVALLSSSKPRARLAS